MANQTVYKKNPGLELGMDLYNTTGADLVQGEFTVLRGRVTVIANEAIANAAVGPCDVSEGDILETADLTAGENTFATKNQIVYFDPTGKKFSDTETIGYYEVGSLTKIKDSGGVIRFQRRKWAKLIEIDET